MMIYNHVLFINITFLFLELTLVLQYCANHNSVFFSCSCFGGDLLLPEKRKQKAPVLKIMLFGLFFSGKEEEYSK